MLKQEVKSISILAIIMSCRMLGLFMILPVFVLGAWQYQYASSFLIGLAIGAYALTQCLLQIPLGLLSDYIGRKKIILFGLIVFAVGSFLAFYTDNIYIVILGRFLQGMGAIASTIMALAADLSPDDKRTKTMAILGFSIGLSFCIAIIIGPIINQHLGLNYIFLITSILAIICMILLIFIPNVKVVSLNCEVKTVPSLLKKVLSNLQLWRINLGVAILHFGMTSLFMIIPVFLSNHLGKEIINHSIYYLVTLIGGLIIAMPIIIWAEKKVKLKQSLLMAITLLIASYMIILFKQQYFTWLILALFIYFTAFNLIEATLPSMVSKFSPAASKGTAMGVFTSCQFMGVFMGGIVAGLTLQYFSKQDLLLIISALCCFWFIITLSMQNPIKYNNFKLRSINKNKEGIEILVKELSKMTSIIDITIIDNKQEILFVKALNDFDATLLEKYPNVEVL